MNNLAKYPISHNGSKRLGEYFKEILTFHIPPSNQKTILDPTCGKRHIWEEYLNPSLIGVAPIKEYGKVVFSDIRDYGQAIVADVNSLDFDYKFDGIVYDPPYFFGYKGSNDPRRVDYGDYVQTIDNLYMFMDTANLKLFDMLKDEGKLIVKCADQYNTTERKFYAHHNAWINRLSNYDIIDLFLFIHHRMSPTAFQVKNRPCSVIMHTYFLVFTKKQNKL
jgi:hypothetical protein